MVTAGLFFGWIVPLLQKPQLAAIYHAFRKISLSYVDGSKGEINAKRVLGERRASARPLSWIEIKVGHGHRWCEEVLCPATSRPSVTC